MKNLMFLIAMFLFLNSMLIAHESMHQHHFSSNHLDQCTRNVLGVVNGKAYLHPEGLYFYQDRFFLQSDSLQWIPLGEVYCDAGGYYVDMREPTCPNGHIGIYRVGRTWYCNEDGCRYSIGENFFH